MEHVARLTGLELVLSTRLTQLPLEGTGTTRTSPFSDLIGRKTDSTATYSGHATLQDVNGVLQVTRTIEGKTDKCVARFDSWQAATRFQCCESIFISMARNMMPPTAGNPTPTITLDLPGTFIAPTASRPDSKRFFQSTDDDNFIGREDALDFRTAFSI